MLAVLLERKTKELGENHDEVIDAKIDLSTVYRRIGKVEKAENLCVSALTVIRDQNRSTEDPRMLKCMNELAKIFLAREKIAQAESMSRNVFERSRLSLGDKSSGSLIRGQVLVESLRKGGKLDEAEELSMNLVSSMEEILGPTHPDTLGAMDALAEIVVAFPEGSIFMNKFWTRKRGCWEINTPKHSQRSRPLPEFSDFRIYRKRRKKSNSWFILD